MARLRSVESIDVSHQDELKAFVSKELLKLYIQSSTVIPVYDRNGKLLEGKNEYMDSSIVKSSIDMLGRSVGLFKDIVESKEEVINITIDGYRRSHVYEGHTRGGGTVNFPHPHTCKSDIHIYDGHTHFIFL